MPSWRLFGRSRRKVEPPRRAGFSSSLRGEFELRIDRLVGTVRDDYEPDVESMHIEAIRRGQVLASCRADWNPEHRRYYFTLPIEGRFTRTDLVKEAVVVIARDSDGKRGRVMLNGAAQLEMVRDYYAVPSVTVLDIDFSRDGNARRYSRTDVVLRWRASASPWRGCCRMTMTPSPDPHPTT